MKNLSRLILVQFLTLSLVWNPAFGQQVGDATQDVAEQEKYKDFVHQNTLDRFEEECDKNNCKNPGPAQNGIDVVNSFIATTAMGLLVGGGIGSLVQSKGFNFKRSANVDAAQKELHLAKKQAKNASGFSSKGNAMDGDFELIDNKKVADAKVTKSQNKLDNAKKNPDEKGGTDLGKICKVVATAGVLGLTLTELLAKNKSGQKYQKTSKEIAQADALYTIANMHEDKKKSNNVKVGIFGTVAACYGVAAAIEYSYPKFNIKKGVEYTIYAGLAGTLATLSGISAKLHRKTSEKAIKSAEAIPQKGDCHPGTPCFCAQNSISSEEHHNALYEVNCVADELQNGDTRNMAMVCLNSSGQPDATCACRASNTCLDSTLNQQIQSIDMDPGLRNNLSDSFSIIAKGSISNSDLSKLTKRGEYFQKAAEKTSDSYLADQNIGTGDPALSSALTSAGMSKSSALLTSQAKLSTKDRQRLANLTGTTQVSKYARAKRRTRSKARRTKQPDFNIGFNASDLMKQLKTTQTAELDPAARLAKYKRIRAQKRAMAMAEINPMENEPIFNIISQRYLKSGFVRIEN